MAEEITPTPEDTSKAAAEQYEVEETGAVAAATPAEAPITATVPEPAKPRHPSWLTKMAADLGVEQEDIDGSTQGELEKIVRYQARQAKSEADSFRREKASQRPQEAPRAAPEPEADLWGKDAEGKPYSESDYLPGIASAIKDVQALRKELKELKAAFQAMGQSVQQREAESAGERIDRFFAELGPEYKEVFGSGSRAELSQQELRRRMAVLNSLGDMSAMHPQFRAELQKASKEIFGDRKPPASPPAPAAEAYTPEQKRWANGAVAKPTHREGSAEPKGPKKAEKAVAAMLKEMGGEQPVDMDEFLE